MTEDEKRQQRAMLLLEYQEAEQHLADLREKSRRLYRALKTMSEWLARSDDGTWNFNPSEEAYLGGDHVKILEDPRFEKAMDFAAMKALATDIKTSIDNLRDLKKRKEQLGLK